MEAETIYGSPGTGKTYTLTNRIKALKSQYLKEEIQVVSHTKVAAKEISDRVEGAMANTIHSLAYRFGEVISDQVASTKEVIQFSEKIGIPVKGVGDDSTMSVEVGDEYMSIISKSSNLLIDPIEYYKTNFGLSGSLEEFSYFYQSYQNWKKTFGFIDFDDMLKVCSNPQPEFKVLFIDEAQDLSPLQWQFIDKIIASGKIEQVVITGDPDQSLFIWGGSDIDGMNKFAKKYNSKVTELTQSYRVPIKVHNIGQKIINKVKNRYEKSYNPTSAIGETIFYNSSVAVDWDDFIGKDVLVLYRTHSLRREIEDDLISLGIPYTCLNGKKAVFDNKYAKAFRIVERMRAEANYALSARQLAVLKSASTIGGERLLKQNNLFMFAKVDPTHSIAFPHEQYEYFRKVYNSGDLNSTPTIKLSTIHGAKGMEADVVMVLDGMTGRVTEEMECSPDDEHRVWFVAVTRTKNTLIWIGSMEGEGYQL